MGLVGQDRGELHTRNRGISRWVTIQWPSHKSCGTASTDVVRGAAGIVGTCCSAGGPTMTRDNGVRRVFTSCAHRQIHGPIQPSVVLKQCHDGRVAPRVLAGHESAGHLLDYKAADEVRSARSDTPISQVEQVTAFV